MSEEAKFDFHGNCMLCTVHRDEHPVQDRAACLMDRNMQIIRQREALRDALRDELNYRNESRREHLVTQEQLAKAKRAGLHDADRILHLLKSAETQREMFAAMMQERDILAALVAAQIEEEENA